MNFKSFIFYRTHINHFHPFLHSCFLWLMRRANEIDLLEMLRCYVKKIICFYEWKKYCFYHDFLLLFFYFSYVKLLYRLGSSGKDTLEKLPLSSFFFLTNMFLPQYYAYKFVRPKKRCWSTTTQVTNPIYWFSQADYVLIIHIFHDVKNKTLTYNIIMF